MNADEKQKSIPPRKTQKDYSENQARIKVGAVD
jgi:hypothetical protein